jgi:hypothetical protein
MNCLDDSTLINKKLKEAIHYYVYRTVRKEKASFKFQKEYFESEITRLNTHMYRIEKRRQDDIKEYERVLKSLDDWEHLCWEQQCEITKLKKENV